eukprot:1158277-Pelagomonas_calceolata.AAC.5
MQHCNSMSDLQALITDTGGVFSPHRKHSEGNVQRHTKALDLSLQERLPEPFTQDSGVASLLWQRKPSLSFLSAACASEWAQRKEHCAQGFSGKDVLSAPANGMPETCDKLHGCRVIGVHLWPALDSSSQIDGQLKPLAQGAQAQEGA